MKKLGEWNVDCTQLAAAVCHRLQQRISGQGSHQRVPQMQKTNKKGQSRPSFPSLVSLSVVRNSHLLIFKDSAVLAGCTGLTKANRCPPGVLETIGLNTETGSASRQSALCCWDIWFHEKSGDHMVQINAIWQSNWP